MDAHPARSASCPVMPFAQMAVYLELWIKSITTSDGTCADTAMAATKILAGSKKWSRITPTGEAMLGLEASLPCYPCPRQVIRHHHRRVTQEEVVPVEDLQDQLL